MHPVHCWCHDCLVAVRVVAPAPAYAAALTAHLDAAEAHFFAGVERVNAAYAIADDRERLIDEARD
jgi:hypothetical protein